MLVEGHFAVVIAHVDLKFFRRATPFPAVIRITDAEIALGCRIAQAATWHEFHPQEAEEQAAEVGEDRDASRRLKYRDDSYNDPNADQVFGP